MKTNKIMRVASVLLVAVLLTTCAISGTFAKYTAAASASATARVALWDIKYNGTEITTDRPVVTFNLFDYSDEGVDVNGADNDDKVIAPGTTGFFNLTVKNDSEVYAKYTITLSETNVGNIPLQYKLDNGDWVDSINGVTVQNQGIAFGAEAVTHTIYWRWVFDAEATQGAHQGQTNDGDTALGEAGEATVTITAAIAVEQIDAPATTPAQQG